MREPGELHGPWTRRALLTAGVGVLAGTLASSSTEVGAGARTQVLSESPINVEAFGISPGSERQGTKLSALSRRYAGATLYVPPGLYGGEDWEPCRLYGGLVSDGAVFRVPELGYSAMYAQGTPTQPLRELRYSGFRLETPAALEEHEGGNGLAGTASNAFMLDHVDGFHVMGVEVEGRFNIGFMFRDAHHGETHDLVATGTDYDGLHNTAGSSDITHWNSRVTDSGDDCFAVISYDSDPARCERIVFEGATAAGSRRARNLSLEGCRDSGIRGGTLADAASRGVLINYGRGEVGSARTTQTNKWPTERAFVDGTTVRGSAQQGIDLGGLNVGTRVRARVVGAGMQAVRVFRSDGALITVLAEDNQAGNMVEVTKDAGTDNEIRRSILRRAAGRGIYDEGTATRIVGNTIDHPGAEAIASYNPSGQLVVDNHALMPDGAKTAFAITGRGTAREARNSASWDGKPGSAVFIGSGVASA